MKLTDYGEDAISSGQGLTLSVDGEGVHILPPRTKASVSLPGRKTKASSHRRKGLGIAKEDVDGDGS